MWIVQKKLNSKLKTECDQVRDHYKVYDKWLGRQPRELMSSRRDEAEMIFLAIRHLTARKRQSILTLLAIVFGSAAFVTITAFFARDSGEFSKLNRNEFLPMSFCALCISRPFCLRLLMWRVQQNICIGCKQRRPL